MSDYVRVAGHTFKSITPGEKCQGGTCAGVSSLVDLCALASVACVMDSGIAHIGNLNAQELDEMKNAARRLREHMDKMFK